MTDRMRIPFNKPCFEGKELSYIAEAITNGQISGDGPFTKKCQQFLAETLGAHRVLLTTSCTHSLYHALTSSRALVRHEELPVPVQAACNAYRILQPEHISFISYPYEWGFSALRDAALLTLAVQKEALSRGMSLKDSSAFNIQFSKGKPIFIDTLSFERYKAGMPWVAYRQFCQHFLAPLALGAYRDERLVRALLRSHTDGIPLDIASSLLPRRTWLRLGLLMHLHLHAKAQSRYARSGRAVSSTGRVKPEALLALVDNLETTVRGLTPNKRDTEWRDYYQQGGNNYSDAATAAKISIVSSFMDSLPALRTCWDFGGNTGRFSVLAADRGMETLVLDIDEKAVDFCYRQMREDCRENLYPIIYDLVNPTPAIGWRNRERDNLWTRGSPDLAMALALVHHLAIANNLPLSTIAALFGELCRYLIIEFVPKDDPQVRRLLTSRVDVFPDYNIGAFETSFSRHFTIVDKRAVSDSSRVLYLMQTRDGGK